MRSAFSNSTTSWPARASCCAHAMPAGPGADDGHALAGLSCRRLRRDPAFFPTLVDDEVLDRLDADRIVVDVERAGGFARRRADASGEFRKVVGRVQHFERLAPLLPVDQVVPVGNDVVDRAAGLAERDAAVHAARALLRRLVVLEREDELAVVAHALADRQRDFGNSLQLDESGDLAHYACSRSDRLARCRRRSPASIRVRRATSSPSARLYSFGNTFTNLRARRVPVVEHAPARACCR